MSAPVLKNDPESRAMARRMRDEQWRFAELVAAQGTLWFCWWDKARRHENSKAEDIYVTGLIDGMELLSWLQSHPDWWEIGDWDEVRYAAPVRITEAGRAALDNRAAYDLEPVEYGAVEPGYQTIPAGESDG